MVEPYTPIQLKILGVLADGGRHKLKEIHECVYPSGKAAVHTQICRLRKKLRPIGQDIICVYNHGFFYQHVRLLIQEE